MFQCVKKYFCLSNQKIHSFILKYIPIVFSYLHIFLRKTPWKLPVYFKILFNFLWNIFENITGMPLRGHLLAARISYLDFLAESVERWNQCSQWTFSNQNDLLRTLVLSLNTLSQEIEMWKSRFLAYFYSKENSLTIQ